MKSKLIAIFLGLLLATMIYGCMNDGIDGVYGKDGLHGKDGGSGYRSGGNRGDGGDVE